MNERTAALLRCRGRRGDGRVAEHAAAQDVAVHQQVRRRAVPHDGPRRDSGGGNLFFLLALFCRRCSPRFESQRHFLLVWRPFAFDAVAPVAMTNMS